MTTARENLSNWLRDAYAMEGQAIELLEAQINRLEGYPEALPRLRSHLNETRAQQTQVESACTGRHRPVDAQGQRHEAHRQRARHAACHGGRAEARARQPCFEQFEAGCYESLMVAAETAGEPRSRTCQRIMEQELDMAAGSGSSFPG